MPMQNDLCISETCVYASGQRLGNGMNVITTHTPTSTDCRLLDTNFTNHCILRSGSVVYVFWYYDCALRYTLYMWKIIYNNFKIHTVTQASSGTWIAWEVLHLIKSEHYIFQLEVVKKGRFGCNEQSIPWNSMTCTLASWLSRLFCPIRYPGRYCIQRHAHIQSVVSNPAPIGAPPTNL